MGCQVSEDIRFARVESSGSPRKDLILRNKHCILKTQELMIQANFQAEEEVELRLHAVASPATFDMGAQMWLNIGNPEKVCSPSPFDAFRTVSIVRPIRNSALQGLLANEISRILNEYMRR